MTLVVLAFAAWVLGWGLNVVLAGSALMARPGGRALPPLVFGITVLIVWELLVRGLKVEAVILPAPSGIAATFSNALPVLWGDFVQTVVMVWAEIVVAALAGSAFYGLVALVERQVTFWHPSQRGG